MRASPSILFALLPLVSLVSASEILNLSKFQEVAGFSFSCTDAYNSPLSGCTADDFSNGAACSQSCITQLELVTDLINTACKGTKAYPNTLIGMFFIGKGVSTLCPNADSSATSAAPGVGGGQNPSTTTAVSMSSSPPQSTSDIPSVQPTATSTIPISPSGSGPSTTVSPSSTTTASSTLSTSPSSSTSTSTTASSTPTTQSSTIPTTVLPTLSITTAQPNPTTLTPLPVSSTSSSTSGAHTTATSGGDKGAVGPILGVTSSSSRNSRSIGLIVASLFGFVSPALLV